MNKLIGVRWGDLEEITKEDLLSKAFYEGTGECIVDLTSDLSIAGEVVDNGEEIVIVINEDSIIYNPADGIVLTPIQADFEINEVMTVTEASEIWGKSEGTIRASIKAGKFILGVDYRKAGRITLITKEAMQRIYGNPK